MDGEGPVDHEADQSLAITSRVAAIAASESKTDSLLDRRGYPPRHAVLIDDPGVSMTVRFVFRLSLRLRPGGKRFGVGGVDILDPEVQSSCARWPLLSRLPKHDQGVANRDFRMHDRRVGIAVTQHFSAAERRLQERQFGV